MQNKTIRLYCVGGMAFNLANELINNNRIKQADSLANVAITLVDSSSSNYNRNKDTFDKANIKPFFFPEVNGAGAQRDYIASKVMPHIPSIVYDSNPTDLNIVIHSASGGTGSSAGCLITKELLSNGYNTMVLLVGDSSTDKFARNTAATIKTYEAFSRELGKPIVCRYYQNHIDALATVDKVNAAITSFIADMRLLFSGNVHSVDDQDLKNLLNFYKVTQSKSALTLISTFGISVGAEPSELQNVLNRALGQGTYNIVAMANVTPYGDAHHQSLPCEYRVEGSVEYSSNEDNKKEIFYVLTDNFFYHVLKEINSVIESYERAARARVNTQIDIGDTGVGGMVF